MIARRAANRDLRVWGARWPLAALNGILCLVLVACAGDGPPPPGRAPATSTNAPSFDAIQSSIFDVNCLSAGCHNPTDHSNNLILAAGQSYAALINVTPFNPAAQAAGLRRVIPGQPERSFLWIKLTGPGPDEGSRMPRNLPPLSDADIDRVRAWIVAGAPGPSQPAPTPTETPAAP